MNEPKKMTRRQIDKAVLVATGFPEKKIWDEYPENPSTTGRFLYYIPSGKPRRTHSIDAVPVPSFSSDMNAAMHLLREIRDGGGEWSLSADQKKTTPFDCRIFPTETTRFIAHGRTEMEAISLCYYEWKTGIRVEVTDE